MQCYRYLAAVTRVAHSIDTIPQLRQRIPYSVLAEWMEQNGIEAEELLQVSGEEVRSIVADLVESNQPQVEPPPRARAA